MQREKDLFTQYFRGIHIRFSRLYARFLTQANLSLPQYTLLSLLSTSGTIPMTEASQRLHISKPAVTYLVDRLEKNRFLKRIAHSSDRRISLLQIQPKGDEVVRKAQSLSLGFLFRTLHPFDPKERKVIGSFYERLLRNMDRVLAEPRGRRK